MRRLLRTLVFLALFAAASVFAAGTLLLQAEPILPRMDPPSPADVRATRAFVHQIRKVTGAETPSTKPFEVPVDSLRATMRLGARLIPGLRSDAAIEDGAVVLTAAIPVPWITGRRWLNIRAGIPPFEGRVALDTVLVGDRVIPPDTALTLARIGANLAFGNQTGDRVLASAASMTVGHDSVAFALNLDREGRGSLIGGVFGALRDGDMPSPDEIEAMYLRLREAMDNGTLPARGSYLPYIRFALNMALEDASEDSLPNAYTAALFALSRACGARDFALVVGRMAAVGPDQRRWKVDCDALTLNGRVDSRRHFTTAAAIQAASNRGFAISIGEFKELADSYKGGSGFDFTDIAANNSGIRMSDLFMARPAADWPALIDRLTTEGAVIVPFDGIPKHMDGPEFKARYTEIDSPAYAAEIARIEARIDTLPLHAN